MSYSAMIFAAGLGTRMGELTASRPKPLISVAGKPLIDHALEVATTPEISRRVVNVHAMAPMIRNHLAGSDVLISDETDALLETGGGLRRALPLLEGDPVVTLNSDAVWRGLNPVTALTAHWRPEMEGLLLIVPPDRSYGHPGAGDFSIGADGRLSRGGPMIYCGLQMIRTGRLASVDATTFSLNLIWDQMLAAGTLYGLLFDGHWCDVGRPANIAIAETMLEAGEDV